MPRRPRHRTDAARPAPAAHSRCQADALESRLFLSAVTPPAAAAAAAAAALPVVSVVAADPQASEVGPDPGRVTFTRTGPTDQPLVVRFSAGGGASSPTGDPEGWGAPDYLPFPGPAYFPQVTIPAGQASADVAVRPVADLFTEGTEPLRLRLTPDPAYAVGAGDEAEVMIADAAPRGTVTVHAADPVATEGGGDPGRFTLTRAGDLSNYLIVSVRAGGTATEPYPSVVPPDAADYATVGESYAFAPGEASLDVPVVAFVDAAAEGNETVVLTVGRSYRDVYDIGPAAAAAVTIADGPPVANRVTVRAAADAWAGDGADAGRNAGASPDLQVRHAAHGGTRITYLRFDLASVPSVASARLRLFGGAVAGRGFVSVFGLPGAAWSESGLTWGNRPANLTPESVGAFSNVGGAHAAEPRWHEALVTEYVQRQKLLGAASVTLAVLSRPDAPLPTLPPDQAVWARFESREAAHPPELVVEQYDDTDLQMLYASHHKLTVPEGGSAQVSAWLRMDDGVVEIVKVPGGDPDLNATTGGIFFHERTSNRPRPFTITAAPDADSVNGTAAFLLNYGGSTRLVTVTEADAGPAPAPGPTLAAYALADQYYRDGEDADHFYARPFDLRVQRSATPGDTREAFLEFDVSALPAADRIAGATLELYGGASAGPVTVGVHPVANVDWFWDEQTNREWGRRPAAAATPVVTQVVNGTARQLYRIDLTAYLRQQKAAGATLVSLALKGTIAGNSLAVFDSDESGVNRPVLRVAQGTPPVSPPPPPSGSTVSIRASADAHVLNGPSATLNYGQGPEMRVRLSSVAGHHREAFLRFDLSQVKAASQVTSAKVRLYGRLSEAGAGATLGLFALTGGTNWSEAGLTWNNKPASGSTPVGATKTVGSTAFGWHEFDVTSYLKQQKQAGAAVVNLAVKATNHTTPHVILLSDEAAANRPELLVTHAGGGPVSPPPPVVPPPPPSGTSVLSGVTIGTPGAYGTTGLTAAKARDGNLSTYFDAPVGSGAWVGVDLGSARTVTQVAYAPRSGFAGRMVGGRFQASSSATFASNVIDLFTVTAAPVAGKLTTVAVNPAGATFRYVRYLAPGNAYGNVAEVQFVGR